MTDIFVLTAAYHFDKIFSNKSNKSDKPNKKIAWIYFILDVSIMAFFNFESSYQTQFWDVWGSRSLMEIARSNFSSLILVTPIFLWLFGIVFKILFVLYKYPQSLVIYVSFFLLTIFMLSFSKMSSVERISFFRHIFKILAFLVQ